MHCHACLGRGTEGGLRTRVSDEGCDETATVVPKGTQGELRPRQLTLHAS